MKTNDISGAYISSSSGLGRFIPEPRTKLGAFGAVLKRVGGAISQAATQTLGLEPEYQELLEKQIEIQQQMQLISMQSNIEKSKHESSMAAIRNIRIN